MSRSWALREAEGEVEMTVPASPGLRPHRPLTSHIGFGDYCPSPVFPP